MRYILWTEGTSDFGLTRVLNWLLQENHVYGDHEAHTVTHKSYPNLEILMKDEVVIASPAGDTAAMLFIHRDADSDEENDGKGPKTRRNEVINWIKEAKEQRVSLPHEVVLIPVQETEAWLLACEATLRSWAGVKESKPIPSLPSKVESQTRPKEQLKLVLETLQEKSMNSKEFSEVRKQLWVQMERVNNGFAPLKRIPAFQMLRDDVAEAVERHGLARL